MIEGGKAEERERWRKIKEEGERKDKRLKWNLNSLFLMRRFRGTRRVGIQDIFSCDDNILQHACPRVLKEFPIHGGPVGDNTK
jgi:hypothetical protein